MDQHDHSVAVETVTARTSEVVSLRRKNRRVAAASMVGTLIEGYDLIIYGTAAALVFPQIFFPALGEAAGTVASLATFAVAFVARPFGSVLFGHFGDRLGRKKTLIATLLLMGAATVFVGLIPPASVIGVAAPIILVLARIVQGVSAGGEWAGAVLFVAEHVPKDKRGFFAMFPQLGAVLPLPFASGTFLLVDLMMDDDAFVSWGWRLPFLASGLLIFVGLWIRLKVEETPVFKKEVARGGASKIPFFEALKSQPRQIFLAAGVGLTVFSFAYLSSTYLTNYGLTTLKLERTPVLLVGVLGGFVYAIAVVIGAIASDRVGRRRVIAGGNAAGVVWALLLLPILEVQSAVTFGLAVCLTFFIAGIIYGPLGAYLPEIFHTRYRYTATGFSYNLTGVVGGGLVPLLAPVIISSFGGIAFGITLAVICGIAATCTLVLGETRDTELDGS
ncbi:MFS transporter [Arthrobacter sp. NPDC093128]|uniref:MFS transporter n=1 Tax=Arthrobacter sp. NPDC093128 TaxID=3154979 RepID=UPI00344269E8